MQALTMTAIGKLELLTVPVPEIRRPDEALIEVKAAGVCGSDLHGYRGDTGRRTPPIVMGHEASGVVRAVGGDVTDVSPGDRVAIHPIYHRNGVRRLMGMDEPGAYAPLVVWPAENLHLLPDQVSFGAGSLAEPLAVAIHALEKIQVSRVRTAVVVGAGTIGLLVAATLKHRGVETVIVTDLSEARLQIAANIGIDAVLDPSTCDVGEEVRHLTRGTGADAAFEAVGVGATVAQAHATTRDRGSVVWVGNNRRTIEVDMQEVVTRELAIHGTYGMSREAFGAAIDLLADGSIPTDTLINRTASLAEGPSLFDELLASPEIVKCVFEFE